VLKRPGAIDIAEVATAVILTGSGGSGKSMMMRHLLISAVQNRAKTPVFYELRHQNQQSEPIRTAVLRTLRSHGLEVDDEYLERALEAGHFSLMLDGFDELKQALREDVARDIQQLAQRHPRNWFTVSSRPDPQLQGWDAFSQMSIQPLDLPSAIDLVLRLPFDDPVKERFVEDLREGLFESHKSFLSNPLLLSIMLLTYSDIAHIPTKLSIFYTQAYESLFQKHDALKGGFQRERRSGLDIQDFAKAFAAFCLQSYDQRVFSFPPTRALDLFDNAKQIAQLSFDSEAILHDAIQAVCLLLEEGVDVTFAHRSFQEYFVARFISSSPPEVKGQLVRRFSPSVESDSVMSLLHELEPHTVEREYILPALETLRRRIKVVRNVGISHFLRYVKTLWSDFEVTHQEHPDLMAGVADLGLYRAMRFMYERYGENIRRSRQEEVSSLSTDDWIKRFEDEFGKDVEVPTKSFTTKTPFVRFLYDQEGHWGAQYLKDVLAIEEFILTRHREAHQTLDRLLSSAPRRRGRGLLQS
jgi:hypothetical protein